MFLDLAELPLNLPEILLNAAFCFQYLVAHELTGNFLDGPFRLPDAAVNLIFVDAHNVLLVVPIALWIVPADPGCNLGSTCLLSLYALARMRDPRTCADAQQAWGCATLGHRPIGTFLNGTMPKSRYGIILSIVLASAAVAYAAEDPPASTGEKISDDVKAATAAVKQEAKVVGAAVKEGAEKVGVETQKAAHEVADATKKGAHKVKAAAKDVAAKTKAAAKSDAADHSENKPEH